jgi:hypothetical protein
MYCLIVWDKELAATGQDGSLRKAEIPADLAKFFFELDSEEFPILYSLSFDDYDLFSDTQLESLAHELLQAAKVNPSASNFIASLVKFILEAKYLKKSVLFDPFRKE